VFQASGGLVRVCIYSFVVVTIVSARVVSHDHICVVFQGFVIGFQFRLQNKGKLS
jgi:hypothetical protein